jgi:MYXO-CTERM domain-containing protein
MVHVDGDGGFDDDAAVKERTDMPQRPSRSIRRASSVLALTLSFTSSAFAALPPAHLAEHGGLESAAGLALRPVRLTQWTVPMRAAAAWTRFADRHGDGWRAYFDTRTEVPGRVYGPGIVAPGAMASAESAERHARALLAEHLDLFVPGAKMSDLELVSNDLSDGLRTVAFEQRHRGLDVIGGQVSVRFKKDRLFVFGSEALPNVDVELAARPIDSERAKEAARAWIAKDFGGTPEVDGVTRRAILPLVPREGALRYHDVLEVAVRSEAPLGHWRVYVDAGSGAPVAREQTLRFQAGPQTGTVELRVPERHPRRPYVNRPAHRMIVQTGGQQAVTDAAGRLQWTNTGTLSGSLTMVGELVQVINQAGNEIGAPFQLPSGGSFVWDESGDEQRNAQLTAFASVNVVKQRMREIAPELAWLDVQLPTNVNIRGNCNAYFDGESINFLQSSSRCQNTALLTDVVYHEFGHGFHLSSIIRGAGSQDGALGEGTSDVTAAVTTGDPATARGFFLNDGPLRDLDPPNDEAIWPDDIGEIHVTGIIYGGTMWDLRKALIARLGPEDGARTMERLWYQSLRRTADIPSAYVEVLAVDDDDGNLANGTPNFCEINQSFGAHGLADPTVGGPGVGAPVLDQLRVSLPVERSVDCPGSTVTRAVLEWQLERDTNIGGSIDLSSVTSGYEGAIPPQPAGEVVRYKIDVTLGDGRVLHYPDNPADPMYQLYVGEVTPIYCHDFEVDPFSEGWRSELLRGTNQEGANDWQWGRPAGTEGSGDPRAAFGGTRVVGNDLGGDRYNGTYQPNKTNALFAPVIDVSGHETVRVQYRRWLSVEDGFFDKASISANGTRVWTNLDTGDGGDTHHQDKEWRFHDLNLTPYVTDGQLAIGFELESDGGLEFGGWTIDDFCIVGVGAAASCGNGRVESGEECDGGDGCAPDCTRIPQDLCGNGVVDAGEACDPGLDATGCSATCTPITVDPGAGGMGADGAGSLNQAEKGCGCSTSSSTDDGRSLLAGLLLLGLGLVARRRR